MKFVHLHTHSHYSLLDGLTKIDELVNYAKEDGAKALALTDHGTMYGVIEFYQKCKKAGLKPIVGVEMYLSPNAMQDKFTKDDERNYHVLLLAKDLEGYKNLIKIVSIGHLEGYYYKPRVDWPTLSKYSRGLIACTSCLAGEIPQLIQAGKLERAKRRSLEYKELFGPGNFYLEVQHHPRLPEQQLVNERLIEFSRELNIPLVATNDIHYLKSDDYDAQDVLLCLQTKRKKEDKDRLEMEGQDFYYKRAREMAEIFADLPEATSNTVKIAEQCNLEIEFGQIQLPHFSVPEGESGDSFLEKLCREGLAARYGKKYEEIDKTKADRLDYELAVIKKMGWSSYFLIVADVVNWAKNNKIVVGPGRGSAAGSFVCYLTGITNIDPLEYGLIFERFLNPDRISMPDIDLDFADVRRDEVIAYTEEKYGKDHVAQIITFGTMAARAAVRDVGRVLDYPYDYCDRLAKMIPMFSKIDQALEMVGELKELYRGEEAARKIIDYARRLEGVARHASTHACGLIITKDPLTDHVPLQYASSSDRNIVSQYSLHPVEDLGLLKMDFLGLKNLTIIEATLKIVKNTRGLEIDINKIPLDDSKTYKLFQQSETTGVFQFESSGMKRYLKELKPTEFEDIIAMVALYRPGPMEWIPDYISGKQGKKKLKYLHPKLEPILKKTYGVAIYQEQVMQMARDLAGFTMAEADVLRKAVGKKIPKLLAEQKEKFVDGCVKNGVSSQLAERIFSFIEPFAGYGFNRSHAACYALIGYQTAYLKANWPAEFMAALLTADQQNTDRIAIEIEECRKMGIEVMPPEINQSFGSFTVVTAGTSLNQAVSAAEKLNTIRFGLKAIKNIGEHIADEIIRERKENGPYQDISDLLERVTDKDLNKKSLESLIKSGALDSFGERGLLLANTETMLNYSKELNKSRSNGQTSLFADAPAMNLKQQVNLLPASPASQRDKLAWEKDLLGLYITEHPFSDFKKRLTGVIIPLAELSASNIGEPQVTVAGIISKIKRIITRTNESMLFVKIEDEASSVEMLVFPAVLKETASVWQEGKIVLCQGKLSDKDQEIKLLLNKATEITLEKLDQAVNDFRRSHGVLRNYKNGNRSYASAGTSGYNNGYKKEKASGSGAAVSDLELFFTGEITQETIEELKKIFLRHSGGNKVYFRVKQHGKDNLIETNFFVNNNKELSSEIGKNFGQLIKILDRQR